ncbi:MAG: DUF2281 domain-containing protein [Deltaproteobacteria bacterium]|nr:DUF2281 domain-containing protein [Deltaproteobacteria bacterium]
MKANKITSDISDQVERLPADLQTEVLDFVQYLNEKQKKEEDSERKDWSQISLEGALRGIEEDPVTYTKKDIKEIF